MLTSDSVNFLYCGDNQVEMEPIYRGKSSNLQKNLFSQKETGYSSHSIVHCMENFVEAVRLMDDTILMPSRLLDLTLVDSSISVPKEFKSLPLTDLYTLYEMVRRLKGLLQWGQSEEQPLQRSSALLSAPVPTTPAVVVGSSTKGHVRRPSNSSLSSSSSLALSEADTESDSGIDGELDGCQSSLSKVNPLENMEQKFLSHVYGFNESLVMLTKAAHYLTKRYQKDVMGITE